MIFDNWVFDSLILTGELFVEALWRFATCVLVNNNLCGKLVSSLISRIIFDDNLKTVSVSYFNANFNLLSSELDTTTFKYLYKSLQTNKNQIIL